MKTLKQMNNLDRAYLIATLFPDKLKNLTEFMKKESEYFQKNKELIANSWTEKHITAEFWYKLITDFEIAYHKNGARLYRNKKTFRDQLFDGYDALFSIHATIRFAEQKECSCEMKYAIYMLFGTKKLIDIDLKSVP
ncbi:hypothetical protein OK18_00365 [Chryseobacterium gallinarum]|uniref:Uncharacterized protein n=1 Tax=Chryseobacterium gallinarum TaxID=1324352 RepID=A0A0G3LY34_CHRGL|nr:hypothetical protein [Chryseobacterium gallinarum]AKK71295.1 hypothetical protein OK18_00365 [Chryseobacterium gallinarum]